MSRDLILIAISMFTWGVGEGMFLYFQPIYLQQLGADPVRIGAILGGFGLMMTISHMPAGYLADRLGRRRFSDVHAALPLAVKPANLGHSRGAPAGVAVEGPSRRNR